MKSDALFKLWCFMSLPVVVPVAISAADGITTSKNPFFDRNLVYDLDGDGVMSIISRDGRNFQKSVLTVFDVDKVSAALSVNEFKVVPEYPSYGTKSKIFDFANIDNSGNAVMLNDNYNAFRFNADRTVERIPLPDVRMAVDADADGLVDFYGYDGDGNHYIHYRQADGSYVDAKLKLTTRKDDVYNSTYYFNPKDFTIPSLQNGWMIGGSGPSSFGTIGAYADLSKNGMPDLLDTNVGGILYNIGDGEYYASHERGVITECDLDGDGILDYVLFDDTEGSVYLMLYDGNGGYSQKLLMDNKNISAAYCHDFDGDGDIDILLPFDWDKGSGYSFVVFYRNDGGGVFKKKETAFEESLRFIDCRDVDADGRYELLFLEQEGFSSSNPVSLAMVECGSDLSLSEPETIEYGIYGSLSASGKPCQYLLGDVDNDGTTECFVRMPEGVAYSKFKSKTNTAPQKMDAPTAYFDEATGKVRISWKKGEDAETSACDLTYELRIGSASGEADILGTTSLPDGRRRCLKDGNAGRSLSKLLNPASMAEGKYYISVQAVDAGGLGGQWSEEFVYEHRPVKVGFSMSSKEISTADTLLLVAKTVAVGDCKWNLGGGTLVAQEGNTAKAVFPKSGGYEISLSVGDLVSDAVAVDVLLAKAVDADLTERGGVYGSADFDSDGLPDMMFAKGVYGNDGKGDLSKVAKTFNTDLSGAVGGIIDFNRDGYPDFIRDEKKGNVFINSGDGDLDFEYATKDFTLDNESNDKVPHGDMWGDFNNDGFPECYDMGGSKVFYNNGGNLHFTLQKGVPVGERVREFRFFADVNRDGFTDVVLESRSDGGYSIYDVLLKDSTAVHSYGDPVAMFKADYISAIDLEAEFFGDINSDGHLDLVRRKAGENFLRVVKGVPQSQFPCSEEVRIPLLGDYEFSLRHLNDRLRDYDNNGYPDILVSVEDPDAPSGDTKEYGILLMQPGFKAELYRSNTDFNPTPFVALKDGDYPFIGNLYAKITGRMENAAPRSPEVVMARQTKEGLQISWSDASDDATLAMQMRYNVGVRKKGRSGEGSYLISPMTGNGGKASPVTSYEYKRSNTMIVPAGVLEAGQTYEVQIQAIDMLNAVSPMSAAVEVTVNVAGYLDMPAKVAVGRETKVKYVGTQASSFSYDLDGGTLVDDNGGGEITVKWAEPGVKRVVVNAGDAVVESSVEVIGLLDVDFTLPDHVIAGAPLEVAVPEVLLDPAVDGGFRVPEGVALNYNKGDKVATLLFSAQGDCEVEAYADDAIAGNRVKHTAHVTESMPVAAISKVEIDGAANRYSIGWDAASLPQFVEKVIVGKETSRTGEFAPLDTVPASDARFVDMSSQPDAVAARYRISYIASNGQTSRESDAHRPLHVMINRAAAGGYNLMWNAYEGIGIESYAILRGSTPENMVELTRIAGSQQNYTDLSAPAGEWCYAVQVVPSAAASVKGVAGRSVSGIRSNAVSTTDAVATVGVESLRILSVESETALTKEQGRLHLFTEILPAGATFNRVAWSVVDGGDFAVIDQDGVLYATGRDNGDVTVRATALDGSGVSAEIVISCTDADGSVEEVADGGKSSLVMKIVYNRGVNTKISGWTPGEPVTIYVVASDGRVASVIRTSEPSIEIPTANLTPGVYIVKAAGSRQ